MEKFCPTCGRLYPDSELTHCETEGERLVIMTNEPELVGSELDGKYFIKAKLGEGGMGTVYVAEQASMGREVAVKVLRPRFSTNKLAIKRFLREARAASRLAHPNTITVYDSGQTPEGLLYQVMERLTGRPLGEIMDEEGALDPPRAVRIMGQICDSLAEAHQNGITHRDLKPENIFIEPTVGNPEFVKVLDFGIAKMSEDNVTQATKTGMICGTPSYMSPEQTMGRELDGRSDIYALGVLLYEMLAGERPFHGETPMEIMLKHINDAPPPLPEGFPDPLRGRLDGLLARMMHKSVEKRPADCQILKKELVAILEGVEFEGAEPAPEPPQTVGSRATAAGVRAVTREKPEFTGLSPAVPRETTDAWAPAPPRWLVPTAVLMAMAVVGGLGAWWWFNMGPGQASAGAPEVTETTARTSEALPETQGAGAGVSPQVAVAPTPDETETGAAVAVPVSVTPGKLVGGALGLATAARLEALASPAPPAQVSLSISSAPSGASVHNAEGTVIGETPLVLSRPADAGPQVLQFKRTGYKDLVTTVDPNAAETWSVTLERRGRKVSGHGSKSSGHKTAGKSEASKGEAKTTPPPEEKPPKKGGFGHGTF